MQNLDVYLSQNKGSRSYSKVNKFSIRIYIAFKTVQSLRSTRGQDSYLFHLCDWGSSEWTEGLESTGNTIAAYKHAPRRNWVGPDIQHFKGSASHTSGQKFCCKASANPHAARANVCTRTCQRHMPEKIKLSTRQVFQLLGCDAYCQAQCGHGSRANYVLELVCLAQTFCAAHWCTLGTVQLKAIVWQTSRNP